MARKATKTRPAGARAAASRRRPAAKARPAHKAARRPAAKGAVRKTLTGRTKAGATPAALARQVVVSHTRMDSFKADGLRPFFEYRDLGLRGVTKGKVQAHVIRARPGLHADAPRHWHDLDFQFVYVLKGWVLFEYDGYGQVKLEAGSMVYQPPRIRHKEIAHSDDLELLEITSPGEFATHAVA